MSIHDHQPIPNLRSYSVTNADGWEEEVDTDEPNMDLACTYATHMACDEFGGPDGPDEEIPMTLTVTDKVTGESRVVNFTLKPHETYPR